MLSEKRRIDKNYSIVNAFTQRYPAEVKEMLTDIEMIAGPFKARGGHPADQWVIDDGVCQNFEKVLTGERTIEDSMMAWRLAVLEMLMTKIPIPTP